MKRFLVLKDRIVVKFNNLDFTGSLDHLGSKDEIVRALSVWVDKEENEENEKELATLLFPEQQKLFEKNQKAMKSVSKLLSENEEDEDENEEDDDIVEESGWAYRDNDYEGEDEDEDENLPG